MNKIVRLILLIMIIGVITKSISARTIGEMNLSGGPVYPQGKHVKYADPGPQFLLRGTFHVSKFKAFSGWFDVNAAFFQSDESPIGITIDDVVFPGKQKTSEYAISLHTGLQLGSDTRNGIFRPRIAIGPGLYFFDTETSIELLDYEDDFDTQNDTQVRFGWRAMIGTEVFFSTKWGLSFDIIFDQVLRLHGSEGLGNSSSNAGFNSYMIGIVIPFKTFDDIPDDEN